MIKSIYLIRGSKEEEYYAFKKRIFKSIEDFIKENNPNAIKVVITENPPPAISIIPFKRKKIAVISVKSENSFADTNLENTDGFVSRFEVKEALPVAYSKSWNDGEATPGINLLTLFNKKKDISYKSFIDIWHNSHTPLSLKIHPLWNYNRNVVERKDEKNIENWDAVVEEHFKERSDLLNPFTFFGCPSKIIGNMIAVYRDTKNFIDYPTMEPYLAKEYHFKS